MKILTHFSRTQFEFDPSFDYSKVVPGFCKPKGLWLSDESEFGWSHWCKGAAWGLDTLAFRNDFKVDLSKIIHLDTNEKIEKFYDEFNKPIDPKYEALTTIDWELIGKHYSGILISPYSPELRIRPDFMWYNGWDCASACIWDLSCLEEVSAWDAIFTAM